MIAITITILIKVSSVIGQLYPITSELAVIGAKPCVRDCLHCEESLPANCPGEVTAVNYYLTDNGLYASYCQTQ